MKKIFHHLLASAVVFNFSGIALAQEVITPPIIVYPSQKVVAADVNQLVSDNTKLLESAKDKEREIDARLHIFKDYAQYDRLREILRGYRDQVDFRDRIIKQRDQDMATLRQELDLIRNKLKEAASAPIKVRVTKDESQDAYREKDAILSLSLMEEQNRKITMYKNELETARQELEAFRAKYNEALKQQIDVTAGPIQVELNATQKETLLLEQAAQLATFKTELVKTKEALLEANRRYDEVIKQLDTSKTAGNTNVTDEKLVLENKSIKSELADLKIKLQRTLDESTQTRSYQEEILQLRSQARDKDAQIQGLQQGKLQGTRKASSSDTESSAIVVVHSTEKDLPVPVQTKTEVVTKVVPDEELVKKFAQQTQELERLTKALKEKDEQLAKIDNTEKDALIAQLKSELAKDDAAFAVIREKGEALQQKIKDQAKALEEKEEFIKGFKSQLANARNDVDGQSKQIKDLTERMNTKEGDLNASLLKAQAQAKEYADQIEALKTDLKTKASLQEQIEHHRVKISTIQEELAGVRTALSSNTQILSQKSTQLSDAAKEISQLQVALKEKDALIEVKSKTVTESIKSLEEKNQQYAAKTSDFSKALERMQLREQLDAKRRQHIELLAKKAALMQSKADQSSEEARRADAKVTAAHDLLNATRQDLETKVTGLEVKVSQSKKDFSQQIDVLNKTIEQKEAQKEEIYRLLDRFKARLKETSDINEDQAKVLAGYTKTIDELNARITHAKEDIQMKDERIASFLGDLNKIKKNQEEIAQESHTKDLTLAMVQASMDEKAKVHEALVGQLKEQIKSTGLQLDAMHEKLTVAEAQLKQASKNDDLTRLQDMLKSSREEVIQLNYLLHQKNDQIKDLQKGLDINSKDFTQQNKTLERIKNEVGKQESSLNVLTENLRWKDLEIARLKLLLKQQGISPAAVIKQAVAAQAPSPVTPAVEIKSPVTKELVTEGYDAYPSLKQALKDADEQIKTLKEKLRLKQAEAVKNDPSYVKLLQEVQALKKQLKSYQEQN